jgi:Uncharacterized conserved protein
MNGQCLCGAVTLRTEDAKEIGACHCSYCRRWGSGGPLLAVHCGTKVEFNGTEQITVYPSSEWAERAFCKRCGTHLYYKLLASGEYFVPAGVFDTQDFEITSQIYIDKKPDFYALANDTPTLTEAQVLELFGVPADEAPK